MKRIHLALGAALLGAALAAPAMADGVGLSINIGEPGFFGRIDLGDAPPPRLVSRRPVWIEHERGAPVQQPIYLHVPPGHQRNWRRYCREYNACGQPVLFVRDDWYQKSYVPHYREHHGDHDRDERRGDEHRDNDHRDNDRHDRDHDQSPR